MNSLSQYLMMRSVCSFSNQEVFLDKIQRFYPMVSFISSKIMTNVNVTILRDMCAEFDEQAQNVINAFCERDSAQSVQEEASVPLRQFGQNASYVDCETFKLSSAHLYQTLRVGLQEGNILPAIFDIFLRKFDDSLRKVSEAVVQYRCSEPPTLFSLGSYLENLQNKYEDQYDKKYWMTASFRRLFMRRADRKENINFIITVNAHVNTSDTIRCALITIVILKILQESTNSINRSILKKLLDVALESTCTTKPLNNSRIIGFFCDANPEIHVPRNLANYINQHRQSPQTI